MFRKPSVLLVLLAFGTIYPIYSYVYLTHQANARQVAREYAAVVERLNQSPSGIPRAEEFIRRIRKINVEHAPLEIQQDLRDYANTLDEALQTLKEGESATGYDKKIGEERDKLITDFKKYN